MKKIFGLLAVICLFAAAPATAQLSYGVKAGLNFSEPPTNISGIKDGHTGWYVGPTLKYTFPVVGLGLGADILYSNSGASVGEETFNKTSLEIPLYLRYDLNIPAAKKAITPFVAVGPQWGYTIGDKEFGKKLSDISSIEDLKEINRYFKFYESCFSLNVGAGIVLLDQFQIHVNYNIALGQTSEYFGNENFKDITLDNFKEKIEYIKSQTNIWQLSVAYLF